MHHKNIFIFEFINQNIVRSSCVFDDRYILTIELVKKKCFHQFNFIGWDVSTWVKMSTVCNQILGA